MYYRPHRFLPSLVGVSTIILLNIIFVTAGWIFGKKDIPVYSAFYSEHFYLLNLWWLAFTYLNSIYLSKKSFSFSFISKHKSNISSTLVIVLVAFLLFFNQLQLLWYFIVSTILCYFLNLILTRFIYTKFGYKTGVNQKTLRRILIIGYNNIAKKLVACLEAENETHHIVGFSENNENILELTNYPVVCNIEQTVEISKKLKITEIFLTITHDSSSYLYPLIRQAESEGMRVLIVPEVSYFAKKPVYIQYIQDMPVLALRSEPLENTINRFVKRFFDIAVSLAVIILILSWTIPLLSIIICIESPGPAFSIHRRLGRMNRLFTYLKFRTTLVNDIDQADFVTVLGNKTYSKIGRILAKTGIDALPQFLNVLIGDMSVVGPAPCLIEDTNKYSTNVKHYLVRQLLNPGVTGWAQVNGFAEEISSENALLKVLDYDLWYLENWGLWLDLKTIFLAIFNKGRRQKES